MTDIDTVVVGAGVVGLAIARALAASGQEVVVLERHRLAGTETSSHNSEVIHAGLYYQPGSLRAQLCVRGKEMLYDFCAENGIAHRRCGKLLIATTEAELPRLKAVAENAAVNGVSDLRILGREEAQALEPELACVGACLSPSTGIIDSHGLIQALEGHLASHGGQVIFDTAVTGLSRSDNGFTIETSSGGVTSALTCRRLVLAGGLCATKLGRMLEYRAGYTVPTTHLARGHYFALHRAAPFRHLIYPMPIGAWLGVHLTLDVSGRARFGPDIEWNDRSDYRFDDDNGGRRASFEKAIRCYWPGLPADALHPDSVGVRPKLYRDGEPVADFAIHGALEHGIDGLIALYGIESPGLTSSLAIGEHVATMLAS